MQLDFPGTLSSSFWNFFLHPLRMLWYKVLFMLDKTTKTITYWRLSTMQSSWKPKLDQTKEFYIFAKLCKSAMPTNKRKKEENQQDSWCTAQAWDNTSPCTTKQDRKETKRFDPLSQRYLAGSLEIRLLSAFCSPDPYDKERNVNLLYPTLPTILKTHFHFTHDSFSLKRLLNIFLKTL